MPGLTLYPAIDLKDGALRPPAAWRDGPGDGLLPMTRPRRREAGRMPGFRWLHVVDLNGAFAGRPVNADAVRAILASTIPVQLGGGIRDVAGIAALAGRRHHARDPGQRRRPRIPALVLEACGEFPGRIAVGIDARGGRVAMEGWAATSELQAVELALRFEDAGVAAIIYTDIGRDGMLTGLNLEQTLDAGGTRVDAGDRVGRGCRPGRPGGAAAGGGVAPGRIRGRHRRPRAV